MARSLRDHQTQRSAAQRPDPSASTLSRAGAEVEPTLATLGQAEDLQGIRDMAGPDIGQRRRGDEVLRRLPAPELGDQKGEALLCFT